MFRTFRYRNLLHSKFWIIILLTLIWVIADTSFEFMFPTYLESIGKSYWLIGLLLSMPAFLGMIFDLPLGNLSDKWSRRKLMAGGLIMLPVFGALIFLFKNNVVLFIMFALWGLSYQTWSVPRDAYFASLTSKKKRAEQYGIDGEFSFLGEAIGPLIGGVLIATFGQFSNLSFYVALCLLAAVLILALVKEKRKKLNVNVVKTILKSEKSIGHDFGILKNAGAYAVMLLLISLLFTVFWTTLYTLEPLFYGSMNLSGAVGGLILSAFSLPAIFLGAPFGRLADKYGKKSLLFIGMLIMGVSLIFFADSKAVLFLVIFALINSVGMILSQPALSGLIVDLAYKHKKGEMSGIWYFFSDLGCIVGPLTAGLLAQFWGLSGAFMIIGWIIIIAALLLIFVRKKPQTYL